MLTEASVGMTKRRAVFVRVNAYRPGDGTTLLDRLVTDEEEAVHTKLLSEYQALEEEYVGQDEIPDEIDTQLGVLEAEMEKTRPLIFNPTKIGRAGAFVTLDRYGTLTVYRGYDHLTSDESVENGIIANEYTFTAGGRRFGWHMGGLNPSLAEYPECMYILHKWRPRSCMSFPSSRLPT
jgi:ParB family chromosome partitioning protein